MTVEKIGASRGKALLIDDETAILRTFRYCLEDAGFVVATAQNSSQAEARLEQEVFDVCFLDLSLGDESGLALLPRLRAAAPWMRIVVATAHSSIDMAVQAMHAGANDFGSIMIEENVVSAAGAPHRFTAAGIQKAINEAGFPAQLRTQQYEFRKMPEVMEEQVITY